MFHQTKKYSQRHIHLDAYHKAVNDIHNIIDESQGNIISYMLYL